MFNYDAEDDIAMLCGCSLLAADSPCQSSQPGPGQSSVTPWSQEQDGKKLRLGLGRDWSCHQPNSRRGKFTEGNSEGKSHSIFTQIVCQLIQKNYKIFFSRIFSNIINVSIVPLAWSWAHCKQRLVCKFPNLLTYFPTYHGRQENVQYKSWCPPWTRTRWTWW